MSDADIMMATKHFHFIMERNWRDSTLLLIVKKVVMDSNVRGVKLIL